MARVSVPLDLLFQIVTGLVADCIDELFVCAEAPALWDKPVILPQEPQRTLEALFRTTITVRQIAMKVVADGLSAGLDTSGVWRLQTNPWRTITCTVALAAQTHACAFTSQDPTPPRPVHAFYALYLAAARELAYAERRLGTLEAKARCAASNTSFDMSEPRAYATLAARRVDRAEATARAAPAAFRALLGSRVAVLHARVREFFDLRLGENTVIEPAICGSEAHEGAGENVSTLPAISSEAHCSQSHV